MTTSAPTAPAPGSFAGPDDLAEVAVVIVTYQSAADLPGLLDSLRDEARHTSLRVIVADNASADGSADLARSAGDVVVVDTGGNLGYAAGINTAVSHAGDARSILVLNPDLVVEPGCIAALLRRLQSSGPGIVVPRILDAAGRLSTSLRCEPSVVRSLGDAVFGRHWPSRPEWLSESIRSSGAYASPRRVDWATGAALLIDRATWDAVGQWDEEFFLYSEETDYFRRTRAHGASVWFEPAATVRHHQGGSGSSDALVALILVNRLRYVEKHHPRSAWLHRLVLILHEELRRGDPARAVGRRALRRRRLWADLPQPRFATPGDSDFPQASVIIPAHNESAVIARTLAPLATLAASGRLEVIVVCNGCTDDTAAIARQRTGVVVVELTEASKVGALNAGDAVATHWPRLYLDADIEVHPAALVPAIRALEGDGTFAARPAFRPDYKGASPLVAAYLRARYRMPSMSQAMWGAGVYGLSRAGHDRLGTFPALTADDLHVDRLFAPGRKRILTGPSVTVRMPRTARGLLAVLVRSRRGSAELAVDTGRSSAGELFRTVTGPRSAWDALCFIGFAGAARLLTRRAARRAGRGVATLWERDDSTRGLPAETRGSVA